jgi:hypothetical protein
VRPQARSEIKRYLGIDVPDDDISAHFQRSSSVLMDPWASASPQRMALPEWEIVLSRNVCSQDR